MKLKTNGVRRVDDGIPYGVYVWRCPDGEVLGDGDGNIMMVFGMRNDREKAIVVANAARHYGFTEGRIEFWPGQRPVSDEEYEEQLQRAKWGLTPDPYDLGALKDELRAKKND